MTEPLVHHDIMHYNDIKLSSLVGNIRLNTAQDNKVYINSENSTLTINENCALGFGKIPDYGNVGDVLISDGEFGSKWSNKYTNLEADVQELREYALELRSFFTALKENIYISDASGQELDYNVLVNGVPEVVIVGATALETEVDKLKTYVNEMKTFFLNFQQSIFLSDENGNELNFSNLL